MPRNTALALSEVKESSLVQHDAVTMAPSALALLAQCAADAPKSALEMQLLELRNESCTALEVNVCDGVLARLLAAPHHRPCSATVVLHDLAQVMHNTFSDGDSKSLAAVAVHWVIGVNGGMGSGACDTGVRWRSCTMLNGVLRASAASRVSSLSDEVKEHIAEFLIDHVQDRSADVRCAAVEGLDQLPLRAVVNVELRQRALFAVTRRALQDCDALVRATAVRAAVNGAIDVPHDLLARVCLDCAPRVRRALLRGLEIKIHEGDASWRHVWPPVVLGALGDFSQSVRAKAVQCLLAGTADGWLTPLLADANLAGQVSVQLASAASQLLQRYPDSSKLRDQLSPDQALFALSEGQGASPAAAVFAHVALVATAETDEALNAGAALPALNAALDRGCALEVQQLLLAMLEIELPPNSSARLDLAKAGISVLVRTPMAGAPETLLSHSVFPPHLLGGRFDASRSNINLAMLLLRRFANNVSDSNEAAKAEAHFSQAANTAMQHMLEQLRVAEELAWRLEGQETREAEAARAAHHECSLRVLLVAIAWLQESRATPARDASQRKLLDEVLRPVLDSSVVGHASHVAAVMGIAVYASKTKETTMSHWRFFFGLLNVQTKQLKHPASSSVVDTSPLCVVARLAEVAVLFLSDAMLLYGSTLGASCFEEALLAFAQTLLALDIGALEVQGMAHLGRHLIQVRSVLCDRICSLSVMGKISFGIPAGQWLLAVLLADVCGPGAGESAPPEELDSRVDKVVASSRILRFFAMLPNLSILHAELLVVTLETFFGARMWMDIPPGRRSTARSSPPVRAARLLCFQLKAAADVALRVPSHHSAAGAEVVAQQFADANVSCYAAMFAALKIRAVRAIVASVLVAPEGHGTMLKNALAAAVLTFAGGGAPFSWAAEESEELGDAVTELLGNKWSSMNHLKAVEPLAEAMRARKVSEGSAEEWVRDELDSAADLRHELATLGLLGPHFDFKSKEKSSKGSEVVVAIPSVRPPCMPPPDNHPTIEFELCDVGTGESIVLPHQGDLTIGRHPSNDVVLRLPSVSGKHCSISSTRFGLELCDHGGSNGTYLNNRRMQPGARMVIKAGDSISVSGQRGPRFKVQHKSAANPKICSLQDGGPEHPLVDQPMDERKQNRSSSQQSDAEQLRQGQCFIVQSQLVASSKTCCLQDERSEHTHIDQPMDEDEQHRASPAQRNVEQSDAEPSRRGPCFEVQHELAGSSKTCNLQDELSERSNLHHPIGVEKQERDSSQQSDAEALRQGPCFEVQLELAGSSKTCNLQDEWSERSNLHYPIGVEKQERDSSQDSDLEALRPGPCFEVQHELAGSSKTCNLQDEWSERSNLHHPIGVEKQERDSSQQSDAEALRQGSSNLDASAKRTEMLPSKLEGTDVAANADDIALQIDDGLKRFGKVGDGLIDLATGSIYRLPQHGVFTIGRFNDCDVTVLAPSVSARHGALICRSGRILLEDMSANGTYVNDVRVPKSIILPEHVTLFHGDRITLARRDGPAFMVFSAAEI